MPAKTLMLAALTSLTVLLGPSAVAGAATLPAAPPPVPLPLPAGVEEGEAEEGEGEAEEGEDEESEELEAEECEPSDRRCLEEVAEEGSGEAAEGCLVSSARTSVAIDARSGKVRVTIRYATFQPAAVAIDLRLRGARGSVSLGARARFGRHGVFHDTILPGRARLARVLAARQFSVGVHAVNTPAYCHRLLDQRLSERHSGGELLWS